MYGPIQVSYPYFKDKINLGTSYKVSIAATKSLLRIYQSFQVVIKLGRFTVFKTRDPNSGFPELLKSNRTMASLTDVFSDWPQSPAVIQ